MKKISNFKTKISSKFKDPNILSTEVYKFSFEPDAENNKGHLHVV